MIRKSAIAISALLLALFTLTATPLVSAQTAAESPKQESCHPTSKSWPIHTYYLKTDDQLAINEIVTVIRNAIGSQPGSSIVPDYTQKAIVVRQDPADIPYVEKILADLDRPRKAFRVTYTLSELDNNKRVGTQHFAVVMVSNQQTKFKQNGKVPISTGSFGSKGELGVQTSFNYVDVGLTIAATLEDIGGGGTLRYDIEQASLPAGSASGLPQESVVRSSSLTGQASLTSGKPLVLGSIDYPGSTRRLDIEALMEPLP